jgi:hypothetical protein
MTVDTHSIVILKQQSLQLKDLKNLINEKENTINKFIPNTYEVIQVCSA